jgi:uncharacterized RDD family membrane protein YckC
VATCPTCGTEEIAGQRVCGSCGTPTPSVSAIPAPLPRFAADTAPVSEVKLASFWHRFLGYLIDYVLLLIIVPLPLSAVNADFAVSLGIVTLIAFLYGSLFVGLNHGQTIGMRLVSIRCVDEDGVTELSYPRAAKRAIAYGVLLLIGSIYHFHRYAHPTMLQMQGEDHHALIFLAFRVPNLLDLLWVSWDKRNQTIHDKVAHTIVIRTK